MTLGLVLTAFIYVIAAAVFRLIVPINKSAALIWLILLGTGLVISANVLLAAYLFGQILWALAVYGLCRLFPRRATTLAWLIFLGLLPANIAPWLSPGMFASLGWWFPEFSHVVWTVGSAFFVIRSFVAVREGLQEGRLAWLPMLAGLTFIPAFSAGPIFGTGPFRLKAIADKLEIRAVFEAIMRFGWSAAAFYVIAPFLRHHIHPGGFLTEVANTYLGLAGLYFDFSGYTGMAIALGTLFGIKLPENFNRPFLATSIREFWQRWHMSLSWFVSTYLFRPFVRRYGRPRTGIFVAFLIVGLWHELSLGYLLWGVGHGAALSLAMKPPTIWTRTMEATPKWLAAAIGWTLTMTWVGALSRLANFL